MSAQVAEYISARPAAPGKVAVDVLRGAQYPPYQ